MGDTDNTNSSAINGCFHPVCHYTIGQSELKGEDVVVAEHRRPWPGSDATEHSIVSIASHASFGGASGDDTGGNSGRWLSTEFSPSCPMCATPTNIYSLFCVFDGHNGPYAARMSGEAVVALIESRLPLGCPPQPDDPLYTHFRESVQLALVESIVELNRLFAQRGIHAGCTATIVLQIGLLLTSVNLGDSRAVVDTGIETICLTEDHRVASHKGERRRVEAMGALVAPIAMWGSGPADDYASGVGPLRIWPGGLCISRAIGDFDVGESVLPFPHLTQLLLPPQGARLLVGSDGVWDAFDKMSRAGNMSRSWSTETAPSRVIQTIVRAFGGLKDDTSLIVADIVPLGMTFPQVVSHVRKSGASNNGSSHGGSLHGGTANGGFCGCFGGGRAVEGAPGYNNPTMDSSVRSVRSGSSSVVSLTGKPKTEIFVSIDVAAVMGLMPEPILVTPGWYNEAVGEVLFKSASEAADVWKDSHEKRYARPPATPAMPEVTRPRRKVGFSVDALGKDENGSQQKSGMRRSASMHFTNATAEGDGDYADRFGHYNAGGSLMEASVRAGRVFNSEASVRAGKNNTRSLPQDPSVHIRGSLMDKSVHGKASMLAAEAEKEDPPGLPPVRVVKRTGNNNGGPKDSKSNPVIVPLAKGKSKKGELEDSAREAESNLAPIGE